MKTAVLKMLVIIGNTITKVGASIGIVGAVIAISSMQALEKHERQKG